MDGMGEVAFFGWKKWVEWVPPMPTLLAAPASSMTPQNYPSPKTSGFLRRWKKNMDRHVFWKPYVWWLKWLPMFCKHAMQVHHMNHSHSHMNSSDIFHANSSVYCSWAVDNLRLGRWVFFWHLKSEEFYFQGTTGYHQRTHSASSLMQVLKI